MYKGIRGFNAARVRSTWPFALPHASHDGWVGLRGDVCLSDSCQLPATINIKDSTHSALFRVDIGFYMGIL